MAQQSGWFGENRRHAEVQKKNDRPRHDPQPKRRPTNIGGIPVPVYVPPDSQMEFVGSKEDMIEAAKKVPSNRQKMATSDRGTYILWTRERG